jgi:hypothetical protein
MPALEPLDHRSGASFRANRTHPSVVKSLPRSREHLDDGGMERELEQLVGLVPPDARLLAYTRRDFLARHARGDVASVGSAHAVEYRVQPQVRLDEDDVLVVLSDMAAMGLTTAP